MLKKQRKNTCVWSIIKQMMSVAENWKGGNWRYFYLLCIISKSSLPVLSEDVRKGTMKDDSGEAEQYKKDCSVVWLIPAGCPGIWKQTRLSRKYLEKAHSQARGSSAAERKAYQVHCGLQGSGVTNTCAGAALSLHRQPPGRWMRQAPGPQPVTTDCHSRGNKLTGLSLCQTLTRCFLHLHLLKWILTNQWQGYHHLPLIGETRALKEKTIAPSHKLINVSSLCRTCSCLSQWTVHSHWLYFPKRNKEMLSSGARYPWNPCLSAVPLCDLGRITPVLWISISFSVKWK